MTKFIKPKIGVITAIGEIPVHVEFFANPQEIILEKKKLIDSLRPPTSVNESSGIAVLNYDDSIVREMGENSRVWVLSYGFEQGADVRASNFELKTTEQNEENFTTITFKLNYKGSAVPVKLNNILGKHQIYPILAATAVGIGFKLNLVEIVEGLKSYQVLPGRMKLLKGIKNTIIIDDTYNAALLSVIAAIDAMKNFTDRRKIVVLGDMLEIGKYAPEAHQRVGRKASEVADMIFTVGERAKFIAQAARDKGFSPDKIFEFSTSDEAKKVVQDKIKEGDVILVKGSRLIKMEKVVKEIMAEPQKARTLLASD